MLVENLVFVYHVIKASENLLTQASVMALTRRDRNLMLYFAKHLEEEQGHARWLAEDLASVGVDVRRTKIPRAAVEMVGTVYYMIFHADPCALLGYMRVLEGWSQPDEATLKDWEAQFGKALLRTTRHHVTHDPAHLVDLQTMIDRLSADRRALVEQTASITCEYLARGAADLVEG